MYTDIWGPYAIPAFGKDEAIYFWTATCEKSRYRWVGFIHKKDQFPLEFLKLKTEVELRSGKKIKAV